MIIYTAHKHLDPTTGAHVDSFSDTKNELLADDGATPRQPMDSITPTMVAGVYRVKVTLGDGRLVTMTLIDVIEERTIK